MVGKIKIYTISSCPHCKALKEFLKSKNLEFENFNVEENEDAADYIIKKTSQTGFPVIEIGEEIIIGFNRKKIEEILHDKN